MCVRYRGKACDRERERCGGAEARLASQNVWRRGWSGNPSGKGRWRKIWGAWLSVECLVFGVECLVLSAWCSVLSVECAEFRV